ncbi:MULTISPECIES: inositol monophosphatase family protein [Kocuria]|jgi:myo-inositol-1(or 4)-monophosphatase|uniref:inositol monophosphatase family protein n=1 Tax=Kocuria TaxID=57493 RepID=UPI0025B75364|nr:inositol monophosphatase family protein [Kocuria rosea]WJZ65434.1 inositol monophosphatase family protein [Kocuria rosea]
MGRHDDALEGLGPTGAHLEELLELALAAAESGAEVLRGRDAGRLGVTGKSGEGDWVTRFDVAAEQAVLRTILDRRPHDTVTGEESGTHRPEHPSGIRWSVDPLDGTTNFIRGIVYYCTSVAAADAQGNWLVGAVNAPALRRTYFAVRGAGAWVEEDGASRRLEGPVPDRPGRLYGTGFSFDADRRERQFPAFAATMRQYTDMRRLGSAALDLCLVADGALDGYGEQGLHEHDWAAGALIAEEAGALVTRPELPSPAAGEVPAADRLAAWITARERGIPG